MSTYSRLETADPASISLSHAFGISLELDQPRIVRLVALTRLAPLA